MKMMKHLLITVLACIFTVAINAQEKMNAESIIIANEDSCSTESIQSAIDACLLLAESSASMDSIALMQAKLALKDSNLSDFDSLQSKDSTKESLNGHLVFNAKFAEQLAKGNNPYSKADSLNRPSTHRGQMKGGEILTKTCLVKANGKAVYEFGSQGRQELAVVAEPGGLVSTRIHVTNKTKGIDEWHNDTVDVAKGRNSRKAAFTLPDGSVCKVTLEITNCTDKDISVVVISN